MAKKNDDDMRQEQLQKDILRFAGFSSLVVMPFALCDVGWRNCVSSDTRESKIAFEKKIGVLIFYDFSVRNCAVGHQKSGHFYPLLFTMSVPVHIYAYCLCIICLSHFQSFCTSGEREPVTVENFVIYL
jgi:hypothetical protein